ncbi:hypothetical protein QE152_g6610 [Popillia japonica]|uniref:Uncharacterized protein n=1 Tax=Popillia japonica TaxID=7064 RepID=A0AAW1MHJ1_POPJA
MTIRLQVQKKMQLRYKKKFLIRSKKVIPVAGAEEDATEIQEEVSDTEQEGDSSEEEEIAEKKGKCVYFLGPDKTSQWNKHCPSKKVRTRKANIVKHLPGVANCAKHTKSVLETWDLFFPEEILRIIV